MVNRNQIVIFGAGKIGRSFIGQLFGCSGYQVVFIDIDPVIIARLNEAGSYRIIIKAEQEEVITVPNVRAVSVLEREKVVEAVSTAGILAVSVGIHALEQIVPHIAGGLIERRKNYPEEPVDIILAENMRSAADFMKIRLIKELPAGFPLKSLVGLVETSIGKMVPNILQSDLEKDPLTLYAEPYNCLILDKKAFKCPVPEVKGLCPKENIKAWVDRKAFIHNLGHAAVAYFGNFKHPGATYIYEVLNDPKVYSFSREVMLQAATVLQSLYPEDFSLKELTDHVDDLLFRFQNKALKDTIFRVGQDRLRKLGPEDRFVGIIRLAICLKMNYSKILEAMAYAFYFTASGENGKRSPEEIVFCNYLSEGLKFTLQKVCGFDPVKDEMLIEDVMQYCTLIKRKILK